MAREMYRHQRLKHKDWWKQQQEAKEQEVQITNYHCDVCPMSFQKKIQLVNHRRRAHTPNERDKAKTKISTHKCELCERGHNTSEALRKHKYRCKAIKVAIKVKEEYKVVKHDVKSDASIEIDPKSKSKVDGIALNIKTSRRKASMEKRPTMKKLKRDAEVVNKRVQKQKEKEVKRQEMWESRSKSIVKGLKDKLTKIEKKRNQQQLDQFFKSKKALKEEQERIEQEEKVPKSERMTAEKRITQEIAEDQAKKEQLRRLTHGPMKKEEDTEKDTNEPRSASARKRKFAQNFYALDTEITSKKCPGLIEVGVVLFKNGEEKDFFVERFMPTRRITTEAEAIHGLSKFRLMMEECKKFSKEASERISEFLHREEGLPIVAHNVSFDRDSVLKAAFKKVENEERLPKDDRWRCTWEMSKIIPEIEWNNLDEVLEHFGFDNRGDKCHDALTDARCVAKVYMAMMNQPEKKKLSLGFASK